MQNIYGTHPPAPEEHHEAREDIKTIMQFMQTQSYDMEGLVQANTVLARSKSEVLAQLAQITVTMNNIQAKLKTLTSAQTNQARPKRKHY